MSKKTDLTGKSFGPWTVIGPSLERGNKRWDVVCICGQTQQMAYQSLWQINYRLRKGKERKFRCPHDHFQDLRRKRFGSLIVVEPIGYKPNPNSQGGDRIWKCLCDCGEMASVRHSSLLKTGRKERKSVLGCEGCVQRFWDQKQREDEAQRYGVDPAWEGYEEITRNYWIYIMRSAERRNMKFCLTPQQAWKQFSIQEKKCALTGWTLILPVGVTSLDRNRTASLDRIDSSQGYVEGNVQWLHKDINIAKLDLPQEEFINLCKLVTDYRNDPTRPVHDVFAGVDTQ